jgi:DNA helicase-2/ATP-dependent DNA helicase PcrA
MCRRILPDAWGFIGPATLPTPGARPGTPGAPGWGPEPPPGVPGRHAVSVALRRVPAPTDLTTHPDVAGLVAGLEPAQREAVLANEPVVCVLAGAGTGKTRVLTVRVARRIVDASAHPGHVLVCTFSRKAAQELRTRLFKLGVGRDVEAGTFHRTALRLIGQHRHDRGQGPPVVAADRRPLLADLLGVGGRATGRGRRGAADHRHDVGRLDAEIGWAKSRLVGPAGYEEASRRAGRRAPMPAVKVAELYAGYEDARRRRGVLDLDDLLWAAGDLLEQEPAFARAMRWWHRHLFVDEMQDLNDAQYRLLRLLVGEEPDLFVVGDPNQSVYGWNGADPELLQRVTEQFAGTRVVRLETNHRCAAPVVRIASAGLGRTDAPPSTRSDGPIPAVSCFENDVEEARWVARQAWLAHRPGRKWSSIAVLARTNSQLTRLAQALDAEHVPYRVSGSDLGPASDVRGGPGPDEVDEADEADEGDDRRAGDAEGDAESSQAGDGDGRGDRDRDRDRDRPGAASRVSQRAAFGPGDDAVTLSTFHRAKGLEWRTVFVVGVSDGLVPLVTARAGAARAEERRLFYVALSRAEEQLTCTWAMRPDAATDADNVNRRRASPWLPSVERAIEELREGATEASPARASQHIAVMRDHLVSRGAQADVAP